MPEHTDISETFGQRVRRARERNGQSRAVVGGLVGRSAEWVKAVECGRLRTPRLSLLLRLADVLGVNDLADLTGDDRVTVATYAKTAHPSLSAVRAALSSYRLSGSDEEPDEAEELAAVYPRRGTCGTPQASTAPVSRSCCPTSSPTRSTPPAPSKARTGAEPSSPWPRRTIWRSSSSPSSPPPNW